MGAFLRFCGEVLATVLVLGVLSVAGVVIIGGVLWYAATGERDGRAA